MKDKYKKPATTVLTLTAILSTVSAQTKTTENEAEKSTVTGTRIAQANVTSTLPVTIYTRDDILRSGESNAADFIRSLPVNSFGSLRPHPRTNTQENSFISMRGLGASRTLVLMDGRRMPKSPTSAAATNLNIIPMGAIERIEVLSEGASAIYGTDAIGGVINIITKKNFQGAEILLGAGAPSIPKNGGETEYGSIVFGTVSERSKLVAGVSWNEREITFKRDVPWTRSFASIYGNSFTTITDGFDNFDWTSFVGACDFPNSAFFTVINNSSSNGTRCAYDTSLVSSEDVSSENKAFYTNATHDINETWTLEANTMFSQTESFGQYAPVPDSSYFSTPLSANSLNNPTNPNSPLYDPSLDLDPQAVNWWHRFEALGNRETTVKTEFLDMKINVSGQLGLAYTELGIRHTNNQSSDVGKNYLLRSAAQAFIEAGTYSLQNPFDASESVLNAMRFTRFRDARHDQDELFANFTFDLFSFKGGTTKLLLGTEYIKEKFFDTQDPQSQAGQLSGSVGISAFSNRDTQSAFFAAHLPIVDKLLVELAGRYDDYSDLGEDLSGKISLQHQPFESLSIYSSYSTNHQTPNLKMMNNIEYTSSVTVRSFWPGCLEFPSSCSLTVYETVKPNSRLKSEQSEQLNLIFNYRPKNWLNILVKLWRIEINDRFRIFNAQQIISAEARGLAAPDGLSCIRSPTGAIIECITGYGNKGSLDLYGTDLKLEIIYPLFGGVVNNQLYVNHTHDLKEDGTGINLINTPIYPKQRAVLNNSYQIKNWDLAYNINMIGSYRELNGSSSAPSWITHDVQINYHLPWQSQITIGAKNIGEKFPSIRAGLFGANDYNFDLYDGFGRIVYARYTQTF